MARRVGKRERETTESSVDWRERASFFFLPRTRRKKEKEQNQPPFPSSLPSRSTPLTCIAATATAARANRPVSLWASMSFVLFFWGGSELEGGKRAEHFAATVFFLLCVPPAARRMLTEKRGAECAPLRASACIARSRRRRRTHLCVC